ncbi:multidrug effflux MFS transporter [Dokdonella sp.]|uniref:multidrug effflux MFS transporter n=1 Tax=Dokdonella sp. TaxID=2291710 RepID=UPI0025C31102|nr:multidrug effflux MFS transporter [Dokdonella sp.]MBX3688483.1 multidrug effflux MFS transporter [Dokdonella sp.]
MTQVVPAIPTPRPRRRILAPLLGGLSMFGPFSIDTIFPAFPALEADLRASPIAVQQTISTYLVAYAVMALVYGPLSDALGRRRVILAGLFVYALASIGCAHAHDLDTLLVFRALQGMSAGAGLIVGRAIIRDCFDGAEAQKLMATVSMIFAVAPALAPIVGGWVIAFAHWPMIFHLLAGFAVVLTLACAAWLPETHPRERRVGLSLRELAATNRSIVTDRAFFPLMLSGSFNFNALWIYISSAPVFVIDMLKLDAQQFGWLFVPAISGMMLGSFLSGRVAGRLTAAATIRIGYAIMLLACAINLGVSWALPQPQLPWSVLPIGLHAIGIGLSFPTLTLLLLDRFPHHRGAASSVQAFVSLLISALIAGALAPVLSASPMRLALAATIVTALGLVSWRIYLAIVRRW